MNRIPTVCKNTACHHEEEKHDKICCFEVESSNATSDQNGGARRETFQTLYVVEFNFISKQKFRRWL